MAHRSYVHAYTGPGTNKLCAVTPVLHPVWRHHLLQDGNSPEPVRHVDARPEPNVDYAAFVAP
ncbi:Uncharacterised protein [Shigella sonnei]|nr:Uncharacterised protein [Shigella sonnei]CSP82601.1 Uncharacterised protein [Shigella sonnei]CSQ83449.1 Uncharacterised protein [Shigella sonnei]